LAYCGSNEPSILEPFDCYPNHTRKQPARSQGASAAKGLIALFIPLYHCIDSVQQLQISVGILSREQCFSRNPLIVNSRPVAQFNLLYLGAVKDARTLPCGPMEKREVPPNARSKRRVAEDRMEEHLVRAACIPEKSWQAPIRLHEFDDVLAGFSRQCPPVAAAVRLEYPEAFPMIPLCQTHLRQNP